MILVTLLAGAVMLASSTRWWTAFAPSKQAASVKKITDVTRSPVVVKHLEQQSLEITASYSGMVESFEEYQYSFDIAGRGCADPANLRLALEQAATWSNERSLRQSMADASTSR